MSERGRTFAARIWSHRAHAEIAAAGRFERLTGELMRLDAHTQVQKMAAAAVEDEVRHHRLCAELARHFGATGVSRTANEPPPVTLGTTTARDALLCELVAMSCITETLSAALLLEISRDAQEDAVREVAREVVRDEIDHSRLGWAHLAAEAERRDVSFLAPLVPQMLATTVDEEIFGAAEADGDLARELSGLGGLARRRRREVFMETMNDVVIPGLRHFGIDPQPAQDWLGKHARQD